MTEIAQIELVLSAARRLAGEYAEQASAYEFKYNSPAIAKETIEKHYRPLKDAIDLVTETALTPAEIDALLWAVRNVDGEALDRAQLARRFGDGTGHGALSSGTNKIERLLGAYTRSGETR